jgi:hypothetical protein
MFLSSVDNNRKMQRAGRVNDAASFLSPFFGFTLIETTTALAAGMAHHA